MFVRPKASSKMTDIESNKLDSIETYHTIILGAGLAGLTAAVDASEEAAKNNKNEKILVVESRHQEEYALRPQLIHLADQVKGYLILYCTEKDWVFKKKLMNNQYLAMKDIQRFLKSKVDDQFCNFSFNTKAVQIDLDEGYMLISQPSSTSAKKVLFEHLILADGTNSDTINLLAPHIIYRPVQGRSEIHHVSGYCTVQSKDNKPLSEWPNFMKKPLEFIIHGTRYGHIYYERYDPSLTKIKIMLVMNVSKDMADTCRKDKSLGIAYLKHLIATVFDEKNFTIKMTQSKSHPKKDELKYNIFQLQFVEAEKPAFSHKGKTIILAGDRRRSPDFYQGHGASDAISDGMRAALVVHKKMSLDEYISFSKARSKYLSEGTKKLQDFNLDDYVTHRASTFSINSKFQTKNGPSEEKIEKERFLICAINRDNLVVARQHGAIEVEGKIKPNSKFVLIKLQSALLKKQVHGGIREKIGADRLASNNISSGALAYLTTHPLITIDEEQSGKKVLTFPAELRSQIINVCEDFDNFSKEQNNAARVIQSFFKKVTRKKKEANFLDKLKTDIHRCTEEENFGAVQILAKRACKMRPGTR